MVDKLLTTEQRRALLIGCPVGGLQGVAMDLQVMDSVLGRHGFTSTKCYPATRAHIVAAWNELIKQTKPGDVVVVYYSGHGGFTETSGREDTNKPSRIQYLIPVDFEETTEDDWRGITDLELSKFLRMTTDKTENVTMILDCCHAARMARRQGTVKTINRNDYRQVLKHVERMVDKGLFDHTPHHERNPLAVCIAASAETESAYEQDFPGDSGDIRMSVLTEALEKALRLFIRQDGKHAQVSWRSVMLRVRDRTRLTCPQQYPQVEGDDLRLTFSLKKADLHGAISVSRDGDVAILSGGSLHGVNEGDVYAVLPYGEESLDPSKQIAEVVVTEVGPEVSIARFEGSEGSANPLFDDGAKAFPKERALAPLSVALQGSGACAEQFRASLESSKLLRIANANDHAVFATVTCEASRLSLQSHEAETPYLLADLHFQHQKPVSEITESIARLESLARAQHVLTLEGETGFDAISEQLDVEFGLVRNGRCEPLSDGTISIEDGERFYLKTRNASPSTVYVSIFDVCAGSVSLLSTGSPSGRELRQNQVYEYGERDFKRQLIGSKVSWPGRVPRAGEIPETIILVVSDGRIDLRGLETGWRLTQRGNQTRELNSLIRKLGSASLRDVAPESQHSNYIRYGVRRFFFQLKLSSSSGSVQSDVMRAHSQTLNHPTLSPEDGGSSQSGTPVEEHDELKNRPIPASELPAPETIGDWEDVSSQPTSTGMEKGFFGTMVRTAAGVPPCVWVTNQHTEEITVVVSQYRPNLLLTGVGLNASATGAGVNFSATTFLSPATKKTLAPQVHEPERSTAAFPLWTRADGFGVISIFTGTDKVLYIENDRVPLGATIYFTNKPDLTIVRYGQAKPMSSA